MSKGEIIKRLNVILKQHKADWSWIADTIDVPIDYLELLKKKQRLPKEIEVRLVEIITLNEPWPLT